jgi:hypothetical protein
MGDSMRFLTIIALLLATVASSAVSAEADRPPPLDCKVGPLHKTYGQTQWLVYACDDARSVVVVSDKDNPALPFYFIIYVKPNRDMQLYGEGNGKKAATQAAFDDLGKLTETDVAALVEQAQAISTTSGGE